MKSSLLWFQIPHYGSLRNLSGFDIISKMNILSEKAIKILLHFSTTYQIK